MKIKKLNLFKLLFFKKKQAGFTLVEMLTVLIVVAIIIGVGIGGLEAIRPEQEADFMVLEVKKDLNEVMMMSMTKQGAPPPLGGFGISFDLFNNHYILFADHNNNGIKDTREEIGLKITEIGGDPFVIERIKVVDEANITTNITDGNVLIIFRLPDPNIVLISDRPSPTNDRNEVIITLETRQGIQREIKINKIGLITLHE